MRQPDAISLRELQEPLLEDGNHDCSDPQAEKDLVRRLDKRLLAFAMLGNLVKALDNSALGSAFISGMEEELHITGVQYNWMTVVFIAGYLTMQVPSNVLLSRLRPSAYLPTLELVWSISTLLMGFVQNVYQVYPIRVILGLAEAGFYPGIVFLFGTWYSKNELGTRMALLNASSALGAGLSGFLQAIMLKTLDGFLGISGWRWMFLLDGCLTAILAMFGRRYLPDYPQNTAWLTEKERNIIKRRAEEKKESDKSAASWNSLTRLLKSHYLYLFLAGWTSLQIALGSTHVLGIVAKRLGYDAVTANLLTTPTTLLVMSAGLISGYVSDREQSRFWCIFPPAALGLVGAIMLANFVKPFGLLYAGFLVNHVGIGSISALVMTWASESMSQERGMRALAVSILNTSASSTSLWTPLILWPVTDAPRYHTGFTTAAMCTFIFLIAISIISYVQKHDISCIARQDSSFDKDEPL